MKHGLNAQPGSQGPLRNTSVKIGMIQKILVSPTYIQLQKVGGCVTKPMDRGPDYSESVFAAPDVHDNI